MVRVRTIKAAAAYFKAARPNSYMNEESIKRLIATNHVPCIRVGKKRLVTIEAIEEYLDEKPDNSWYN